MRSVDYKKYCADQKITVMGLGLLGRALGDIKFLAENGADLIVTDLKTEQELAPSLKKLTFSNNQPRGLIKFVLGEHRLEDFRGRDLIIKAAGVPLDSPHVAEAKKHHISVQMSTALFAQIAMINGVKIIGVTGTRGKSTTTQLIYEILRAAKFRVYLGGNVKGVSTLALLKKVKAGDWAVLELDSWQLQGFGELKISPQIAVFTNFMTDHLNYYGSTMLTTSQAMKRYRADKENIFKFQQPGDYTVKGWELNTLVPRSWQVKLLGEHNKKNIACAVKVAEILQINKKIVRAVVENFPGVPGRLELVRVWRGIKFYNDTTATTPEAVIAAVRALNQLGRIILIGGGADKALDYREYAALIPKQVKKLILFPGTATVKILTVLKANRQAPGKFSTQIIDRMKEAIAAALVIAKKGDIVLLSPGAASFGLPPAGFKNEFDRGEQFVKLIRRLR